MPAPSSGATTRRNPNRKTSRRRKFARNQVTMDGDGLKGVFRGKCSLCMEERSPVERNKGIGWGRTGKMPRMDLGTTARAQVIPMKFRRIRSPASPLFSGWNCTPYTFPFLMVEANGPQYSVAVTVYSGSVTAW